MAAEPAAPAGRLLLGCPVDALPEVPDLPAGDPLDQRIEIFTGRAEVDLDSGALFENDVSIRRGEAVLTAPGGRYDRATGRFDLEDGLRYRDPVTAVDGRDATFDAQAGRLRIDGAQYHVLTVPARGSAGTIEIERDRQLHLRDVSYTTCATGDEDWLLRAGRIDINRDTGIATARNARLVFMGVPILYTPWIAYPVTNERTTGFLLPALGRSESRGVEFQIPYYLNLAPNYDATLTPRYMSQRGLELLSEFRYLWPGHSGEIAAEYLPNDDTTGDDRYLFGWEHQSHLGRGWRATLDGEAVSDTRYFEDLYGSLSATSQTHLERILEIERYADLWSVLARFQSFETLDESLVGADKPYRRAPQLAAGMYLPDGLLGLDWRLDGDFTVFERNTGTTGSRLHLAPGIALPMEYRGLRIEPAVAVTHTAYYDLKNRDPGVGEDPSRSTPVWSVDAGAVFERGARGTGGWLQTLEPRIQYVHIPFSAQDDLPVFDTIEPDFNMVQLFRRNRFLGLDRIGDTDQLNIGLTSRVIDADDGTQYLTATVGQTRFFSSQDVTLPGGDRIDSNSSDWLAELGLNFRRNWKLDLGYQWNNEDSNTQRAQGRLQYRRDGRHVANLAYRYRRDEVEEIDVSAAWPLSARWSAVGRYDYSLLEDEVLERFVGIEYQNCCWGLRLVYRNYVASRSGEKDSAIAVQLVLKGLTNVGDSADRLLERGILGYEAD
ncbi:MAG: LPS-assembly protein LptD [Gammaproteobacteria bacterium]|nr:LPS-assembly protein LptD [Gammaproteobacteria bacterium]